MLHQQNHTNQDNSKFKNDLFDNIGNEKIDEN